MHITRDGETMFSEEDIDKDMSHLEFDEDGYISFRSVEDKSDPSL